MSALSDRYEVLGLLASGGMASVLYGRLRGPAGFQREVAIKRLHPHFAREPEFLQMFIDEAHICARLSHANIVSALDVIETPPDLCLVMEYVPGAGLDVLLHASRAQGADVPLRVAGALLTNVLRGLHAAHEARDDHGSLGIVHRDVSPSNVLVGEDGVARVLDFGIARARSKLRNTPGNELKGKFSYMAPELLRGEEFDRRLDVYAASVVLWEVLAGRALYGGQPSAAIMRQILEGEIAPPSRYRDDVPSALDELVMHGLARDPEARVPSARELATALERECGVASQHEVSEWMHGLVGELLARRAHELRRLQRDTPREPTTMVGEREEVPTLAPRRSDPELTLVEAPLELLARAETPAPSVPPPARKRGALVAVVLASAFAILALLYTRAQMTPTKTSAAPPPAQVVVAPAIPLAPPDAEPPRVQEAAVEAPKLERRLPRKRVRAAAVEEAPARAPDPCLDPSQLEMIDGVVVKTYKAECLK
ncbi:MAG TPA: protein kinase [Polyangiales bacterium]|nr:protein kinase [Polyangiales bacterium]